jgi:hypothetical protein
MTDYRDIDDIILDGAPDVGFASAANFMVMMKKRAQIEEPVVIYEAPVVHEFDESWLQKEASKIDTTILAAASGLKKRAGYRKLKAKLAAELEGSSSGVSGGPVRGPDKIGDRRQRVQKDTTEYQYDQPDGDISEKEAQVRVIDPREAYAARGLRLGSRPKARSQTFNQKTAEKLKWHEHARIPMGAVGGALGGAALGSRAGSSPMAHALGAGAGALLGGVGGGVLGAATLSRGAKHEYLKQMRTGLAAEARKNPGNAAMQRELAAFDTMLAKSKERATAAKKKTAMSAKVRRGVHLIKKAQEAGMSVGDYVTAERAAKETQSTNELEHTRAVAQQAQQQAAEALQRASAAEQQLAMTSQQMQQLGMQAQQAQQMAADSEANAAEQQNAKLRMKMRIDQMRQALADIAAQNPAVDDVPPQPGMPPGPQPPADAQQAAMQQQAAQGQDAGQQPVSAGAAKEQQQAAQAQAEAQKQTAQAQQKTQQDAAKAQVPAMAGMPGAPAVAPAVQAPTVPGATPPPQVPSAG